jgi:hypothetical protein
LGFEIVTGTLALISAIFLVEDHCNTVNFEMVNSALSTISSTNSLGVVSLSCLGPKTTREMMIQRTMKTSKMRKHTPTTTANGNRYLFRSNGRSSVRNRRKLEREKKANVSTKPHPI